MNQTSSSNINEGEDLNNQYYGSTEKVSSLNTIQKVNVPYKSQSRMHKPIYFTGMGASKDSGYFMHETGYDGNEGKASTHRKVCATTSTAIEKNTNVGKSQCKPHQEREDDSLQVGDDSTTKKNANDLDKCEDMMPINLSIPKPSSPASQHGMSDKVESEGGEKRML